MYIDKVDPLHIKEEDIYLEDIAHALSLLCRGNGHIKYFYSVAQHSLNCAKEAQNRGYSKDVVLSCLFHDASETYMSDLITPIKKQMKEYQVIEDKLLETIFQAFHIQLKNEEKNIWKEMDHLLLEAELKELLENSGYEAVIIKDFNNAEENILNEDADLILLDINLPQINGTMLLNSIRKKSNIPIIMVTSKTSEVDEVLSISYGADDYITKPYNPTILLLRIQNIFKRMDISKDDMKYNGVTINSGKGTLTKGEKVLELTKNEMIIFTYLFSKKGTIVSRNDLMTDLWNNNEYINDNALTVNISRLRAKLEEFGLNNVIETRKGQGYKLI